MSRIPIQPPSPTDFNDDTSFPDITGFDALLSIFSGGSCLR